MTLFGKVYDLSAAQRMGVVNRIVPSERLIDEAVAWAGAVEPGCHPAYAFTNAPCKPPHCGQSMTRDASILISSQAE